MKKKKKDKICQTCEWWCKEDNICLGTHRFKIGKTGFRWNGESLKGAHIWLCTSPEFYCKYWKEIEEV